MSSFFKKLGKDINSGFKKAGSGLKATFKKGGYIDQGLDKVAGVAKQVGKFAGKAGGVLANVAPSLALIPGVGAELALGAGALGKFAQKAGSTAGKVGAGVRKAEDIKKGLVKGATAGLKGVPLTTATATATPMSLEKPQPEEEDMIGLANPAFEFV
jgi:hypothetical protein